ncbi:APC family permease [Nocardioides sp. CER19]|uniref:APC family permease n=1 Tax=Nocardioides sp. CER19 TaxID=3038538 RepID=UPI0024498B33|nr:APC family permease [Nocardioides sp. CER19]MDH2414368.1 APC family permease [Nocardioides sp. CER19]
MASTSGLRGSIGVVGIVFLVVAAASPLTTVAGSLPVMIALGNGAGAPLTYLIAALVLLLFSVGYAAMSSRITDAGAFYAYVTQGLGRRLGIGAAGLALFAYATIQAGVYGLAASTVEGLVVQYGGPDLPWWFWAFVMMALVGVVGYRNISLGARLLGVLLALEIIAIAVLTVAVFAHGGAHGIDLESFKPSTFVSGSPGIAMMFAIGSFVGFEATAIYSEEARNPKRTVPVATYVAIIVIGVLYALSSWAVVLAFGSGEVQDAALKDTAGLTFGAAATYVGSWTSDAMQVMLVTSLFATLLAFHGAISRYVFALARAGYAPRGLAAVHAKHGSPHAGSLLQTASAVVLVGIFAVAGADPVLQLFTWMAGVAIVAILALMALTSFAILAYFRRTRVDTRVWQTVVAPILGGLGLIAILALVIANFTTLIGGSRTTAAIFLAAVVVTFLGGVVLGGRSSARVLGDEAPDLEPTPVP